MKLNEIDIYDFLKDYVDKTIIFIANPGNAGDYLITYSTILIFRKRLQIYKNQLSLLWTTDKGHL